MLPEPNDGQSCSDPMPASVPSESCCGSVSWNAFITHSLLRPPDNVRVCRHDVEAEHPAEVTHWITRRRRHAIDLDARDASPGCPGRSWCTRNCQSQADAQSIWVAVAKVLSRVWPLTVATFDSRTAISSRQQRVTTNCRHRVSQTHTIQGASNRPALLLECKTCPRWGDLFAVDRAEKFVVIELKLSQGRNKTLGQLLYYMGWVDQHLGNGPCRGIIIASEITEELSVAVARVPGVQLAKYRMSFAIEPLGAAHPLVPGYPAR